MHPAFRVSPKASSILISCGVFLFVSSIGFLILSSVLVSNGISDNKVYCTTECSTLRIQQQNNEIIVTAKLKLPLYCQEDPSQHKTEIQAAVNITSFPNGLKHSDILHKYALGNNYTCWVDSTYIFENNSYTSESFIDGVHLSENNPPNVVLAHYPRLPSLTMSTLLFSIIGMSISASGIYIYRYFFHHYANIGILKYYTITTTFEADTIFLSKIAERRRFLLAMISFVASFSFLLLISFASVNNQVYLSWLLLTTFVISLLSTLGLPLNSKVPLVKYVLSVIVLLAVIMGFIVGYGVFSLIAVFLEPKEERLSNIYGIVISILMHVLFIILMRALFDYAILISHVNRTEQTLGSVENSPSSGLWSFFRISILVSGLSVQTLLLCILLLLSSINLHPTVSLIKFWLLIAPLSTALAAIFAGKELIGIIGNAIGVVISLISLMLFHDELTKLEMACSFLNVVGCFVFFVLITLLLIFEIRRRKSLDNTASNNDQSGKFIEL